MPFAVKDTHALKGWRTTYGSPIFADHVPDFSDWSVERIEAGDAARPQQPAGANSAREIVERLRENPLPLVVAAVLFVLLAIWWVQEIGLEGAPLAMIASMAADLNAVLKLPEVADTLGYAHRCGVAHGEVRAEHILVGRWGEVVRRSGATVE